MRIHRRDKLKIYGDLLSAINLQGKSEKIVLTKIQTQINVPFDRLKDYISELNTLELIQNEPNLILTEKGKQYLSEYSKILEFMKSMGLTYK
jgi:predicted transcriptional regulator